MIFLNFLLKHPLPRLSLIDLQLMHAWEPLHITSYPHFTIYEHFLLGCFKYHQVFTNWKLRFGWLWYEWANARVKIPWFNLPALSPTLLWAKIASLNASSKVSGKTILSFVQNGCWQRVEIGVSDKAIICLCTQSSRVGTYHDSLCLVMSLTKLWSWSTFELTS